MKQNLRTIVESIIIFAAVFFMTLLNILSPIDYMLSDRLYQIPRGVSSSIKIIGIDEKTLAALGPINTWSRSVYADLITMLDNPEYKPAVIGIDVIFQGNVDEGDTALAEAAAAAGNVVTSTEYLYAEKPELSDAGLLIYPVIGVDYPYDSLKNSSAYGFTNVSQDSDAIVRRLNSKESYGNESQEIFSKVVYDTYCKANNIESVDIVADKYGRTLINYSGKPGDYEEISLIDVLEGRVDVRTFKNSIVLVGAYASGMQDNFKVPNGGSRQMFGVEIHANILQAFMMNRFAVNGNPVVCGLVFALVAAAAHLIIRRRRLYVGIITLAVCLAGAVIAGTVMNNNGICIPIIYMPLMVVVSFVYSLAINYLGESIKRKRVLNAFKKYVAPEIVEELARKGDFKISLGGENRDIAVLFVDIRGFTTMSEALEPEQVVEILNRYLTLTSEAILGNKGTLDKFVGDATMAVFNSPFDLDDYVYRAVKTAMDIAAGGDAIEEEFKQRFGKSVGFGVGVNCGPAVVGNVGSDFRMDFTAIGDTVNTAARLEANAAKGQVLISDEVYNRLEGRIEVTEVGNIPLKGKSNGVFVYSVDRLL